MYTKTSVLELAGSSGAGRVIRDLKQLGRERQQRRLLNFYLSVFPFLVCISRAFLFRFA